MTSPPIPNPPRAAGQFLAEWQFAWWFTAIFVPFLVAGFLVVLAVTEWYRWAFDVPTAPMTYTWAAVAGVLFALAWIPWARRRLAWIRQGMQGERFVGAMLDELRSDGASVYHDIPGDGFNVDHVVIHRTGVYAIETKAWSKTDRSGHTLTFDGQAIRRRDRLPDDWPVKQATAGALWLRQRLHRATGRQLPVRPVLVFPGWFVQGRPAPGADSLWVLNPKGLRAFLAREPTRLSEEDQALCRDRLEIHIRDG